MALNSYQDLVAAVSNWPDLRGEPSLEAVVPTLIRLAETRIKNDVNLRLQGMLTRITDTVTADDGRAALPANCLQVNYVTTGSRFLNLVPLELFREDCAGGQYAIEGRELVFGGPIGEYTLSYFAPPHALEDSVTHWLFEKSPDLYLYGTLIEAAIFTKESEQETARYNQAYESCVSRLTNDDWNAKVAGGQVMRTRMKGA